jgi:hypothetical protein
MIQDNNQIKPNAQSLQMAVMGSAKFYKQSPKHKFWKNSLNVFYKIESIGKGMNLFKWKENGEEKGCYTLGITVHADWFKITEQDYENAIPTHCP